MKGKRFSWRGNSSRSTRGATNAVPPVNQPTVADTGFTSEPGKAAFAAVARFEFSGKVRACRSGPPGFALGASKDLLRPAKSAPDLTKSELQKARLKPKKKTLENQLPSNHFLA